MKKFILSLIPLCGMFFLPVSFADVDNDSTALASEQSALSLGQSVAGAKSFHPALKSAKSRLQLSEAEHSEMKSGFYPQIRGSLTAGEEYADTYATRAFLGGSNEEYTEKWNLSVRQRVFDGLETEKRAKAGRYKVEASEYSVLDVESRVAMEAIRAHIDVLKAQALLHSALANSRQHKIYVEHLNKQVKQGVLGSEKLMQAQSRMTLAKTSEIENDSLLKQARLRYLETTGLHANRLQPVTEKAHNEKTYQQYVGEALQFNPRIKQAASTVFEASNMKTAAQGKYYPRVELVANGTLSDASADNTFTQDGEDLVNTFMGVEISYQFFAGGANKAREKQMMYRYEDAQYRLLSTQRDTREEAAKAYMGYESLRMQQPELEDYAYKTKKVLKAYIEQFKVNRRSLLDVLNQQNEFFNANNRLIENQYALIQSAYYLDFVAGQLSVEEENTDSL